MVENHNTPVAIEVVDLGRPKISGIVQAWRGLEDELGLGLVPVGQPITAV
jgi:hypothetical protein